MTALVEQAAHLTSEVSRTRRSPCQIIWICQAHSGAALVRSRIWSARAGRRTPFSRGAHNRKAGSRHGLTSRADLAQEPLARAAKASLDGVLTEGLVRRTLELPRATEWL